MTSEDLEQLSDVANGLPAFESVGLFSPLRDAELALFPHGKRLPRWRWDLNKPGRKQFDLLVACNVFMHAPDPAQWFRHVLASCRYFLLLDLIRRKRSPDAEEGPFGDAVRFSVGGEETRIANTFTLESLGDRLLAYRTFYGGANEFDDDPLHFIALIRGDLAEPVIRIDDYPTGIRPILPDLSPIHEVIQKFEEAGLPYYLGIVPGLLDDNMLRFLQSLEHMRPAVHGYDHAYPNYAPYLSAKGDPYNEHTVRTFNEFRGHTVEQIKEKLTDGRKKLEDSLGREATTYIPACNRGDRRTGQALQEAGYKQYMSEKSIPFCRLPQFKSDFYGRSNEYDYSARPRVVTLHTTWEWDVHRKGNPNSLDRLVKHLGTRLIDDRQLHARIASATSR